jgi:hypothetical protein
VPTLVNGTQCMFIPTLKKFTCRSDKSIVECDGISHLDGVSFELFGLGHMSVSNGEVEKYWMYPRDVNSSVYLNHTLISDVKDKLPINVMLYHGDKFVDFGIRVEDLKCYKRLVSLLDSVKEEHLVNIDSELEVKPTVSLISEVLVMGRSLSRRAFAIEALGRFGPFGGLGGFGGLLMLGLLG